MYSVSTGCKEYSMCMYVRTSQKGQFFIPFPDVEWLLHIRVLSLNLPQFQDYIWARTMTNFYLGIISDKCLPKTFYVTDFDYFFTSVSWPARGRKKAEQQAHEVGSSPYSWASPARCLSIHDVLINRVRYRVRMCPDQMLEELDLVIRRKFTKNTF